MRALLIAALLACGPASAESVTIVKEVPPNSVVQLVVGGRVVQSQSLQPGTYRITIDEVGDTFDSRWRDRVHPPRK